MFKTINCIFNKYCNYEYINGRYNKKLRKCVDGIQLTSALIYKLLYTKIDSTKEIVTSQINKLTSKEFTRQSYESKENNIHINVYKNICRDIIKYYNDTHTNNKDKLIAIDGTATSAS
jgi:hypothetical protein